MAHKFSSQTSLRNQPIPSPNSRASEGKGDRVALWIDINTKLEITGATWESLENGGTGFSDGEIE